MASIYPVGTARQLLALCEIHQTEKRLPYVAWRLWWAGYDVPLRYARSFLHQAAATWERELRELQALQADPEALAGFLARAQNLRLPRKTLAQVRKRVGRKDFPTFLDVFIRIASGTFEGYATDAQTGSDERERTIVEKGLGLQRARTDWMRGAAPWLTGDTGPLFKDLSHWLHDHPMGEDVNVIEDANLLRTRDEVRDFLSAIEEISALLDAMFGRGAFGFSAFAGAIREMEPKEQAFMLLSWRMLRTWKWGAELDGWIQLVRIWHLFLRPLIQGIQQLFTEVPALPEDLTLRQAGIALRRKAAWEGLQETLHQLSQQLGVKAFFARHPEFTQLLDAYQEEQQGKSDG